ncbi:MAG TPA: hypothetical protein VFA57_11835 [Pseudolabrys sp.]|jgi:hypothetical protein|nr:hypothetical protein [Pseudolabrys sp.]
MDIARIETFVRKARQDKQQHDINYNLLRAAVEINDAIKRLNADIQSVRSQAKRRF